MSQTVTNSHTHEWRVTTNTIVQVKQCNQSCWLFPRLRIAGMQTGRRWLSWMAWVGGIWPALAAIRSAISTLSWHGRHADSIKVSCRLPADYGSQLRRQRDGGRMYILAVVRCRVWAQKPVSNNRGYAISKYVLTDIFCIEKWQDWEEAYAITEDTL